MDVVRLGKSVRSQEEASAPAHDCGDVSGSVKWENSEKEHCQTMTNLHCGQAHTVVVEGDYKGRIPTGHRNTDSGALRGARYWGGDQGDMGVEEEIFKSSEAEGRARIPGRRLEMHL